MKRQIISILLVVCLVVPVAVGAAARTDNITRAEFLTLLAKASGENIRLYAGDPSPFGDVRASDAWSSAVNWAYAKWLVNGNGAGSFRPNDLITRQEAAAILGRYLDYRYTALPAGCGTSAPNQANLAAWAKNDVVKCWMYCVIDTSGQSDFRPTRPVEISEAKTWVSNAQKLTMSALSTPEKRAFTDALVSAAAPKGNFLLSPYSLRLCLAMVANGAKGTTQNELLNALQIDDLSAFNQSVRKQLATYDGYARVMALKTSDSIWLNQDWFGGKGQFLPAYKQAMTDFYRAEAREVTNQNSVEQVNQWVNQKTNGKIPTILTEDHRNFVAALVNAVYFRAAWAKEFSPSETVKGSFHNADGSNTQIDFMNQTDTFGYYCTPGVEALKLNYSNIAMDNAEGANFERFPGADFSMYLMKASGTLDVQNFLNQAEFKSCKVQISLPKFKLEYSKTLDDTLKALGVAAAYDSNKADLSAMVNPSGLPNGKLYLDTVLQKTYLAIDEQGTEAAAVTAAIAGATSAPSRPELIRVFTADSPFYLAIRDNTSGEILFVGRYETAT